MPCIYSVSFTIVPIIYQCIIVSHIIVHIYTYGYIHIILQYIIRNYILRVYIMYIYIYIYMVIISNTITEHACSISPGALIYCIISVLLYGDLIILVPPHIVNVFVYIPYTLVF